MKTITYVMSDDGPYVFLYYYNNKMHFSVDYSECRQLSDKYPFLVHTSVFLDIPEPGTEIPDFNKLKVPAVIFEQGQLYFPGKSSGMYYPPSARYQNRRYAIIRTVHTLNTDKTISFDFLYSNREIIPLSIPQGASLEKFARARLRELFTPQKNHIHHVRVSICPGSRVPRYVLSEDQCSAIDIISLKKYKLYTRDNMRILYNLFSLMNIVSFDVTVHEIDSVCISPQVQ